jgi:hypothetical protein
VAAGHASRRRWNPESEWVWSAEPAHQPLVSRQTFEAVQARLNNRPAGTPRKGRSQGRVYLLRGRLRCGLCQRRLQGQWVHQQAYYRCRYPAEYASAAGFDHPRSVYLREGDLLPAIDAWLARLADPEHLQATCEAIAAASHTSTALEVNGPPPGRSWPTASGALAATGPRWRPAPIPTSLATGSRRSPRPGTPPKPSSASWPRHRRRSVLSRSAA